MQCCCAPTSTCKYKNACLLNSNLPITLTLLFILFINIYASPFLLPPPLPSLPHVSFNFLSL